MFDIPSFEQKILDHAPRIVRFQRQAGSRRLLGLKDTASLRFRSSDAPDWQRKTSRFTFNVRSCPEDLERSTLA